MEPNNDPYQRVGNELTVSRPGERTICEIKRHPIGIIGIYGMIILILIVVAVVAFEVAPALTRSSGYSGTVTQIGAVIFGVTLLSSLIYAFIAQKVYWGNRWVVTTDSVTQILQTGLFTRQSSQLALHDIEDITSEQNGLLSQALNFGVLKAETAGHRAKFVFLYCPNPNFYAQTILQAREAFEDHLHGTDGSP